jgi:hypothetical protein
MGAKDNGALLSVNLLKNDIGIDQAQALASILKGHPALKSLCGNKGNATELDMVAMHLLSSSLGHLRQQDPS